MQRSRYFDRIRRRWRIAVACGLAACDRSANWLFCAGDNEPAMRSIEQNAEKLIGGTITLNGVPADRLRIDYAIWKLDQQQKAIEKLREDLVSHQQDCCAFSGAVGDDVKKANIEIRGIKSKQAAWESQRTADAETHNALAEEVEQLRKWLGEMEDRFACRTDMFANPSQN
jgi:hypothetical protein